MKTTRLIPGLLLLAALFAGNLAAETQLTLQFNGGTYIAPGIGYYVDPYTATVLSKPGHPKLTIYCDDYSTEIFSGNIWTARVSNITNDDLADTHFGNRADRLDRYTQAAYLLDHLLNPGIDIYWRAVYTVAVWDLFTDGAAEASRYGAAPGNAVFQGDVAAAQVDNGWQSFDPSGWHVLTDIRTGTDQDRQRVQEFMYHTPEPSAFLLLGGGLVALGFMRRRRKAA